MELSSLYPTAAAASIADFMFMKCLMSRTKKNLLKRFNVKDEEEFKKQLNFKAIMILCGPMRLLTAFQLFTDIICSKDGNVNGPRRKQGDPQTVKVFFNNPDLFYADDFPEPRLGPAIFTTQLEATIKQAYGLDLEYEMSGKPTKIT